MIVDENKPVPVASRALKGMMAVPLGLRTEP